MQNLRNRKRLMGVTIAFLLTFVIGAAFAFPPGHIDIIGGIATGRMCVIWEDATTTQSAAGVASTNVARITDHAINGDDHRIEWAIGFAEPGTVTLTANAINDGIVDVNLGTPTIAWGLFGQEGFTYTIDATAFLATNPLSPGDSSGDIVVTITKPTNWTMPVSLISPASTAWINNELDNYAEVWTTFTITVQYTQAP